uniref:Uncharacterized protein n=1 Tax=Ciona savignyi TaxID=51511 RepID=H2Z976_CIOSA
MRVKCTTVLEITKSVGSVTSSFLSRIAGYKCIPGYIGQSSHFHTSKWCHRWNTPSAEMRIAKITRDQGLPHRNDISLNKPLFFRKGRNLEAWKERLKPKKLIYEKETTVNETPQDDVYLRHLYKPQVLSIQDSVKTLKEYTELDYTDQESIVTLKLGLIENYVGKGGRKRIVTFFDTTELPNPGGIPNKVCLFTDMEESAELAIDNGAVDAGGAELIHKVMCDQVVCDAYLSTVTFHDKVRVASQVELYERN